MSSLSLIGEYSSDTEDEKSSPPNVISKRLPVPQSILSWKGVKHHEEIEDDPTLHDGRIRSFKHERGNWATLVYILCKPSKALQKWMENVRCEQFFENGKLFDEFHISLTRTVVLKFHWINSFVEGLKEICKNLNSFTVELKDIKVYCNDDRTRTFLGITCENNKALKSITETLNKLLNEYQLPCFYEEASHHISFLWSLGAQEEELKKHLPILSGSLKTFLLENFEDGFIEVNELHCKIGNKLYTFNLKPEFVL